MSAITKWLLTSAGLGLLVPAVLMGKFLLDRQQFGLFELALWPTSLALLANEAARTSIEVVKNFAIAISLNVAVYVFIGASLYSIARLVGRLRHG